LGGDVAGGIEMAVRSYPSWITIGRVLALVVLLLTILTTVPGMPDWLLAAAVGLLAIAVMFG
jgi:hypothetical protein